MSDYFYNGGGLGEAGGEVDAEGVVVLLHRVLVGHGYGPRQAGNGVGPGGAGVSEVRVLFGNQGGKDLGEPVDGLEDLGGVGVVGLGEDEVLDGVERRHGIACLVWLKA